MSHWYDHSGKPVFTIIGANGKERPTTLRDARKLNLVPSVTTVIKAVLAAPQLENWIQGQLLDVAYAMPPINDELPDDWKRAVKDKAAEAGKARMEFGTLVHDALEKSLKGEELTVLDVVTPSGETHSIHEFIGPVIELIRDNGWRILECEKSLVGDGYAGTSDIIYIGDEEYGIIDFKTTKDATNPFIPPTYPAQIALYHVAEHGGIDDKAAGYNVFISTESNIGAVKAVRYDAERLRKEYEFGMGLVKIWQHLNNYTPEL